MLNVSNYIDNDRIYIGATSVKDNEPYGDVTINLPEFFVRDIDEGFLDSFTNSSDINLIPAMKKLGIIKESYGKRNYNFGSYEYVKFDLDKLKEYDKKGVDEYLNLYSDIDYDISI